MKVATLNQPVTLPPNLSGVALEFYQEIQIEYQITDSAGIFLLRRASCIHQNIVDIEAVIEKEGLSYVTRLGDTKPHYLLSDLHKARATFLQTLKSLNLDLEPLNDAPGTVPGSSKRC